MNEMDLIAAYRNIAPPTETEWERIERIEDQMGAIKCLVESCLTMIDVSAGRVICRFHANRLRDQSVGDRVRE
jgi:hypothetical protein